MQTEGKPAAMYERHYSPAELGELWNLSADTILRIFEKEPGVMVWENPVRSSSRRSRTLRVPASVAERVYGRLQNRPVDVRMPRGV